MHTETGMILLPFHLPTAVPEREKNQRQRPQEIVLDSGCNMDHNSE